MTTEVYKSSTHGNIPLSFTGRRLLANLRDAIQHAIAAGDFNARGQAVSVARGEIAQYMSKLEEHKRTPAEKFRQFKLDALAYTMNCAPGWDVRPNSMGGAEFSWRASAPFTPEQHADYIRALADEYNVAASELHDAINEAKKAGCIVDWQQGNGLRYTHAGNGKWLTVKYFVSILRTVMSPKTEKVEL